jgi:hypothetical protein
MSFRPGGIQSALWCGSGADGNVTLDADGVLFSDINAKNLTLDGVTNGPINIATGGYRIFVQDKLTIRGGVFLDNSGQNGGSASNTTPGTGGIGAPGVTAGLGGFNGAIGGAVGANGFDGIGPAGSSVAGGGGFGGFSATHDGGAGGDATYDINLSGDPLTPWIMMTGGCTLGPGGMTQLLGGGAGGGGAGTGTKAGGGGGGAGGVIFISAGQYIIEDDAEIGLATNGGNGGTGTSGSGGGGGGGGGMIVVCRGIKKVGSAVIFAYSANGGNGGNSTGGTFGGGGGLGGIILEITEFGVTFEGGAPGSDGTT